jgi:hypothetical protein
MTKVEKKLQTGLNFQKVKCMSLCFAHDSPGNYRLFCLATTLFR